MTNCYLSFIIHKLLVIAILQLFVPSGFIFKPVCIKDLE